MLIKVCSRIFIVSFVIAASGSRLFADEPVGPVPGDHRQTYEKLKDILDDFESLLAIQDTGADHPVTFGALLSTASCERADALLRPQAFTGVIAYLDSLQKLGIKGVTIPIRYPLYTASFPDFGRYQAFYKRVAGEVRRRGLKLTVESQAMFANTCFSSVKFNYAGMTFEQYKKESKEMFQNIIDDLQPDYLNILAEPDTQAVLTGLQEFNDPAQCIEFIDYCLNGLSRQNTRIAAGIGSWGDLEQVRGFAAHTKIDCISLHVYLVSGKSVENIFFVADMARRHQKGLIVDGAWLYKSDKPSSSRNTIWTEMFGRNVFDYWAPLDQQFLSCMVRLSKLQGIEYFSPFGTDYFFAYLRYNSDNAGLCYKSLSSLQHKKEVTNLLSNSFSSTGLHYKRLIEEDR